MRDNYHHSSDIFKFLTEKHDQGQSCALVVIVGIHGGTMRESGAMMAVTDSGEVAGYISSGCVDADIVHQAQQVITNGQPMLVKYGKDSPFKDLELPCGGSIEVLVMTNLDSEIVTIAHQSLQQRLEITLRFSEQNLMTIERESSQIVEQGEGDFVCLYKPKIRLRLVGRGAVVSELAKQAIQSRLDVYLQSPEKKIVEGLNPNHFVHLIDPHNPPASMDDAYTAVVLLFHDHEWEPALLKQALAGNAFYIGAMGSLRTHAIRCARLSDLGVSNAQIDRIKAPLGIIPFMRDANLLALSTLAEIIKEAQILKRL